MPWSNPVIGQLAALMVRTGAANQADALIEKLGRGTAPGAASGLVIVNALRRDLDRAAEWAALAIEERDMPFVLVGWMRLRRSRPAIPTVVEIRVDCLGCQRLRWGDRRKTP